MANVLITLDKPWAGSKDGRLRLKMGSEPCEFPEDGQYGWAGSAAAQGDQAIRPPKVIRGKPIYVYFDSSDPEKATALIPEDWAKLYFGDWDCKEAREDGAQMLRKVQDDGKTFYVPVAIRNEEKDRVATQFGGYMFESERGKKEDQITHVPIGPPNVPHVTIRKTDSLGRPVQGWEYKPHDFFAWSDDFPGFKPFSAKNPPKVVFAYA
jgi:hypothetical protein